MPSVSRSWGYFLLLARNGASQSSPMIRLTEFRLFGCHICPDVSETCCNNGEDLAVQDLAECLGVLQVPIQFNDALFIISGDSGQIPLETVAFVATWSERCFLCHMAPPVSTGQKRNLLSDSVFRQVDLFASASLDAARHAARNVFFSWGSPSRPSTSPGTTLCWHFALSSASRGLTQSLSASAPPQISQSLFLDAFYAPQEVARSPEGVLRG